MQNAEPGTNAAPQEMHVVVLAEPPKFVDAVVGIGCSSLGAGSDGAGAGLIVDTGDGVAIAILAFFRLARIATHAMMKTATNITGIMKIHEKLKGVVGAVPAWLNATLYDNCVVS